MGGPPGDPYYFHEDGNVIPGHSYTYMLQDEDTAGFADLHGPVSAWAGVANIEVNHADGPVNLPVSRPAKIVVVINTSRGDGIEGRALDLLPHVFWLVFLHPAL